LKNVIFVSVFLTITSPFALFASFAVKNNEKFMPRHKAAACPTDDRLWQAG
jgi:hypothetical protein